MMGKSMLGFVKGILHSQAKHIDPHTLKKDYSFQIWDLVISAVELIDEDLKDMGKDLGLILAYRTENEKETREKVKAIIEKAKKINIDD